MQRQQTFATSYGNKLAQYSTQRDEWTRYLQNLLTPTLEQVMRKINKAAEISAQMRPADLTFEIAHARLMDMARAWTDEEVTREMGGERRVEDVDVCLQMTVKAHATMLALASGHSVRQVLSVPSAIKFFKTLMNACAEELAQPELFQTTDIDTRTKVRAWIDQLIKTHAHALVPVGAFAKQPVISVEGDDIAQLRNAEQAMVESVPQTLPMVPANLAEQRAAASPPALPPPPPPPPSPASPPPTPVKTESAEKKEKEETIAVRLPHQSSVQEQHAKKEKETEKKEEEEEEESDEEKEKEEDI